MVAGKSYRAGKATLGLAQTNTDLILIGSWEEYMKARRMKEMIMSLNKKK